MKTDFDIIIVGASLAGSSVAIRLSHSGFKVLLLDKSAFPRVKACGEGLSMFGYSYLKDLPCKDFLSDITKEPYFGFKITHSRTTQYLPCNNNEVVGFGIERNLLDYKLLEIARETTLVQTGPECGVTAINLKDSCAEVFSNGEKYTAKYLIAADGARSKIANLCFPNKRSKSKDRYGLKCSLQLKSFHGLDRVNIFVKNGYEIYITPVAPDRLNLALLGNRKIIGQFAQSSNLELVLLELKKSLGLDFERASDPIVTGPLGTRLKSPFASRVLFIGDAAETFDPLGGMGMSHALWTAKRASQAILMAEQSGNFIDQAMLYAQERERQARIFRGFTKLAFLTIKHLSKTPLPIWGRLSESAENALLFNRNKLMSGFMSLVGTLS